MRNDVLPRQKFRKRRIASQLPRRQLRCAQEFGNGYVRLVSPSASKARTAASAIRSGCYTCVVRHKHGAHEGRLLRFWYGVWVGKDAEEFVTHSRGGWSCHAA